MLVVMRHGATGEEIDRVVRTIEEMGYQARPMPGAQRTAVGLVGNDGRAENTTVTIAPGVIFGGAQIPVIAGPCSVESEQQIVTAARAVRAAGATCLRGGAFKPRSSPYSFQGLGKRGLELLALARRETGLAIVTEAMDEEGADLVAEWADCLQI